MIRLNGNVLVYTEDRIDRRKTSFLSAAYRPKPEELRSFTEEEIVAYKKKVRSVRRAIEDRQLEKSLAEL